jgi:hypothetical protein
MYRGRWRPTAALAPLASLLLLTSGCGAVATAAPSHAPRVAGAGRRHAPALPAVTTAPPAVPLGAPASAFPGSVAFNPAELAKSHVPWIEATTVMSTHLGKTVGGVYALDPYVHPRAGAPPLPANILIADGRANRILEVNVHKQVVWEMTGIQDPDDIQVYAPGRLLVNQENANRVVAIDMATRRITWSYGHLGTPALGPGAAALTGPGYVNNPDDSYMLPNHDVLIDDANNQRVLVVTPAGRIVWQYGTIDPRTHLGVPGVIPGYLIGPNDAVPQADGNVLITNVGNDAVANSHSVEEVTPSGRILWRMALPLQYPSDALKLPGGSLLVADWVKPGRIYLFGPQGHVRWLYAPTGSQALNHPSSAQLLENGDVLICDDHNDRIVVVQPTGPTSGRIVWQYGQTGVPGTGPGHLDDASGVITVTPSLSPEGTAPGYQPRGNGGRP